MSLPISSSTFSFISVNSLLLINIGCDMIISGFSEISHSSNSFIFFTIADSVKILGVLFQRWITSLFPFVSQNLVHFIGTENELKQLGEIPQSLKIEDLENSVLKIFNNPENYLKCRQVAKKYYDINVTIIQNLKIYQKCSQMYSRNY